MDGKIIRIHNPVDSYLSSETLRSLGVIIGKKKFVLDIESKMVFVFRHYNISRRYHLSGHWVRIEDCHVY